MELFYVKHKTNIIVSGEILKCSSCKMLVMISIHIKYCIRNPDPDNDKRKREGEKKGRRVEKE